MIFASFVMQLQKNTELQNPAAQVAGFLLHRCCLGYSFVGALSSSLEQNLNFVQLRMSMLIYIVPLFF